MSRLAVALIYALSLVPAPVWASMAEGPRPTGEPVVIKIETGTGAQNLNAGSLSPLTGIETSALSTQIPLAELPAEPMQNGPTAVGPNALITNPDITPAAVPTVPLDPSINATVDLPAAAVSEAKSSQRSNEAPPIKFARQLARLLFPKRNLPDDNAAAVAAAVPAEAGVPALEKSSPRQAGPAAKIPASNGAPSVAAKRSFMGATFTYNLATSIMLVVQQVLLFSLAVQDQAARGFSGAQAGFHAAGLVFGLATLTGALRIPGNYLGGWLSSKTDQRNLAGASALSRMAILGTVAALFLTHTITLPLAAALYSLDWFIGGLEEVSRNTQIVALVKPGTKEFKSWSTKSQFLAQLTGLFGPLFVVALAQFKGLDAAGHILAPILFGASALMYFLIPKDSRNRVSESSPEAAPSSWTEKWRGIIKDRALILPVIALALLSTILLKGPLSLNMASLLFGKTGAHLTIYSALFSGIFGAGLGLGSWIAHVQDAKKSGARSAASWLAMSALGTAGLVATWFLGASLPVVAGAWFLFALATAACQLLMTHRLQEYVATAGPGKKYAIGYSLTLANLTITLLRVLAGGIFFLLAGSWRAGFGILGGALLLFALGQWLLSRRMSHER